jgi:hypothetical protein
MVTKKDIKKVNGVNLGRKRVKGGKNSGEEDKGGRIEGGRERKGQG